LAALVALVIAMVAFWFAFLRPHIRSVAKNEAQKTVAAVNTAAKPAGGGGGGGGGGSTGSTVVGPTTLFTRPIDKRLTVNGNGSIGFPFPSSATALDVTDIVFENPKGDTGTITIQRDSDVLMVVAMANFRDLDYHFVTPIHVKKGSKLSMVVTDCTAACTPGAYFSGMVTQIGP
jgi:hypothetical protein